MESLKWQLLPAQMLSIRDSDWLAANPEDDAEPVRKKRRAAELFVRLSGRRGIAPLDGANEAQRLRMQDILKQHRTGIVCIDQSV